jgi:hypothetical protein
MWSVWAATGMAAVLWLAWPIAAVIRGGRPYAPTGRRAVQRRRRPARRVLIVGDSSGVEIEASEPRHSMAGRLAAAHPDWCIGNLAISGSRTADVARLLGRLLTRLRRFGPGPHYDAVVIHAGGADALRFTPDGSLSVSLVIALAAAQAVARHAVLVTGGHQAWAPAFPAPWSWLFGWRGRRVRDLFQAIAWEAGVTCVDVYGPAGDDDSTVADGRRSLDRSTGGWFDPIDEAVTTRLEGRDGHTSLAW